MKMSNINIQSYVNVIETTDMPVDLDVNRSLGVFLRGFAGHSAVKLDPVQWHPDERPETVAKSCATVLFFGAPAFSCDWKRLPEKHLRVVTSWMEFYRQHQLALTSGQFEPANFETYFPQLRISHKDSLYVYCGSQSPQSIDVANYRSAFIINASESPGLLMHCKDKSTSTWKVTYYDCGLAPDAASDRIVVRREGQSLRLRISEGGVARLIRK